MAFNPMTQPLTFAIPSYFTGASAWLEHIPFAFTLTSMLRPRRFVELGVHNGDSYMAFCQAVKSLALQADCTGIDTWQGDEHAGTYPNPLPRLHAEHDPRYGAFSTLLQSTFDNAVQHFQNGSIDLLHIDGLHTYEAVRHDYETWLPKLSAGGIVLFHDTMVMDRGFGVHRFFAELAAMHPNFNFHHAYGLGVLAPKAGISAEIKAFFADANADAQAVRSCYAALGNRIELMQTIFKMTDVSMRTQSSINAIRRRLQLAVDPNSERRDLAFGNPIGFLHAQSNSLKDLLTLSGGLASTGTIR